MKIIPKKLLGLADPARAKVLYIYKMTKVVMIGKY